MVSPAPGQYLIGFGVALVASLLLTPLVRDIASAAGLVDDSDGERKLHLKPVPCLGGIALLSALGIAIGALYAGGGAAAFGASPALLTVMAGGLAMHLLGVLDDVVEIRARYKLIAQVAIALAVSAAGLRIDIISLPGLPELSLPPAIAFTATVLWLVGITNAFNLIDGVDGLAAGAALFALLIMTSIGILNGQWATVWITLSLAGALIGFLVYNVQPASIFLGDSGSLFLGFMLGGLGLLSAQKTSTAIAVAVPILVLGLPVLDMSLSIARRFLRRQEIFLADRGHIHHRLLNLGHSPRVVAAVLCGVSIVLGLAGVVLLARPEYWPVVLSLTALGLVVFVHQLRFDEFEELAGTMVRGVAQRGTIARSVRIREAAARLAEITDLPAVFEAMTKTLEEAGFDRAVVRLRRGFVERGAGLHIADLREADELEVWNWGSSESEDRAWEVSLPLISSGGERIGSLTLWQELRYSEQSLSHWRAVAIYLRAQVERKLELLWHDHRQAMLVNVDLPKPPLPGSGARRDTMPAEPQVPSTVPASLRQNIN